MKQCRYCKIEIDDNDEICPNCNKKQQSSFLNILIAACVIIFLIILAALLTRDDKNNVSVNSSENSVTEKLSEIRQEAEQIIYDKNDIKITYKGFVQEGSSESASFDFLIENNSSQNIFVTSENVSVNDFTFSGFFNENVLAGKNYNSKVKLHDYVLEENDIKNINKIEFNLKFSDSDTSETLFTSGKITITINENADMGEPPEGSRLIHEQDGISVYYVGNTGSWITKDSLRFYIKNDTDKNIIVSSDDVTVNDFIIDSFMFAVNVEKHKKANGTMDLYSNELEKNNIDKIEKVDFILKCYEEDTFDKIWRTDTITIDMN